MGCTISNEDEVVDVDVRNPPPPPPLAPALSSPSPINGIGNDIVESREAIGIGIGIGMIAAGVVCELSEMENRLERIGLVGGCGCDWGRGRGVGWCFLVGVVVVVGVGVVVGDDLRIKEGKPALKYLFLTPTSFSLPSPLPPPPPPAPAPTPPPPAHKSDIPSGIYSNPPTSSKAYPGTSTTTPSSTMLARISALERRMGV